MQSLLLDLSTAFAVQEGPSGLNDSINTYKIKIPILLEKSSNKPCCFCCEEEKEKISLIISVTNNLLRALNDKNTGILDSFTSLYLLFWFSLSNIKPCLIKSLQLINIVSLSNPVYFSSSPVPNGPYSYKVDKILSWVSVKGILFLVFGNNIYQDLSTPINIYFVYTNIGSIGNDIYLFSYFVLSFEMLSKTIRISETTYKELAKRGTLEDSYDKDIQTLLKEKES